METTLQDTAKAAWQKSKWIIKGIIIGLIALMLLIPAMYVKDIVHEREERQREATKEISSKWAGKQNVIGPVLCIPFVRAEKEDTGTKTVLRNHIAYFLPDKLDVEAQFNPKEKHRGIYKVMLYEAKTTLSGSFGKPSFEKFNVLPENIQWQDASVKFSISDSRGLNDQLLLNWNDSLVELSPGNNEEMTARLKTTGAADFENIRFNINIDLNGAEQLYFTPVGKATTVNMQSSWKHPSFSGHVLPQNTELTDSGFKATWKSMSHKRSFPQQWIDDEYRMEDYFAPPPAMEGVRVDGSTRSYADTGASTAVLGTEAFGADLFIPVNGYQKTLRTIKYALLCILLTFAAFFLIETAQKKSAHPFHYGLVGLALILFYTLLLSISEYTGFNTAYVLSSAATIGLIGWFISSVLKSGRAMVILSVVLVLIYSYVFSLLQLQDYSLLLGSMGLFLTLAVIMYFSKKLQW
ncbi:MAG: cell envelope integrity protein CreD [Chitinophagaceae bacterium]|nr:cell envelope integrity protein CreD [Chitinophagaceae bacterium]